MEKIENSWKSEIEEEEEEKHRRMNDRLTSNGSSSN